MESKSISLIVFVGQFTYDDNKNRQYSKRNLASYHIKEPWRQLRYAPAQNKIFRSIFALNTNALLSMIAVIAECCL